MKPLICLPTYNEVENIAPLKQAILKQSPDLHVLVIDDASPDGTAQAVEKLKHESQQAMSRVHILSRGHKNGRGGAVWDGILYGVNNLDVDCFVEMDCDFSHDPLYIMQGLNLLNDGFDAVLATRYPNGRIIGWPISRRLLSRASNQLIRFLISRNYHDYTNGMRFYSKGTAEKILKKGINHPGYINLSETLSFLIREQSSIGSFDITFTNRSKGSSRLNAGELMNALYSIFKMAISHHLKKSGLFIAVNRVKSDPSYRKILLNSRPALKTRINLLTAN